MRYVNGETYNHEDATKIIIDHEKDIKRALGRRYHKDVMEVFKGNSILSDILSSSLDADKMDYLRRDSYHTGVAYGNFNLERVLRTICKIHESDRDYIGIEDKGRESLESYRLARYSMHSQVYEHHTRLIADDMFLRAVITAIQNDELSRDFFDIKIPEKFLAEYMKMDDNSIEHHIMQNSDGISNKLIKDIRSRKLLKRAYVLPLNSENVPNPIQREKLIQMTKNEIEKLEKSMADEIGIEQNYVIIHLQSIKIKLYERFEQTIGKKEKPILIQKRDGSVISFDEVSSIWATNNPIRRLYVFCPVKYVESVKKMAEDKFKIKSVY